MSPKRFWPKGHPPVEADAIELSCRSCGLSWSIHKDLAGGRLACECSAWLQVPALVQPNYLPLHKPAQAQALLDGPAPRPLSVEDEVVAFMKPLESYEANRKESTVALLQFALIMACFLVPGLIVQIFVEEELAGLLLPVLGLLSGALVLLVGALSGGLAFTALRSAKASAFGEAALVAVGMFTFAILLVKGMESGSTGGTSEFTELIDFLGPALSLFTIALCPALFEELAFRGLMHSRAQRVLGKKQGLMVTACAFMLAHGISLASPIHLVLGLHLSWLRDRSGSLFPGMVEHFVYNALVLSFLY